MARVRTKMAELCVFVVHVILLIANSFALDYYENALNVPQLLLPYTPSDAVAANYTLRALKGCLRWWVLFRN